MTSIAAAKAAATRLRQRQELKQTPGEQAYAASRYFRRQKVVIGVSLCRLISTTNLLLLLHQY